MLTSIKQRFGHDDEQGFTLIELMVVVLIIAILLAIAIPTFLGARNTANGRAAQSDLRNGLTAEQTFYTNSQTFSATVTDLAGIEPNLAWSATSPVTDASPNAILMTLVGPDQIELTIVGKDHNCYNVAQYNQSTGSGATLVGAGTYYTLAAATKGTTNYTCAAATVPTATPTTVKAVAGTWALGW